MNIGLKTIGLLATMSLVLIASVTAADKTQRTLAQVLVPAITDLRAALTVEDLHAADVPAVLDRWVEPPTAPLDSPTSLREYLKEVAPEYTLSESEDSRVFHLRHKRLVELKEYALNQDVSINFEGTTQQLLEELSKSAPTLSPRVQMSPEEFATADLSAPVAIDAVEMNLGEVLTRALKDRADRRLLWVSRTTIIDDRPVTQVRYIAHRGEPAKKN